MTGRVATYARTMTDSIERASRVEPTRRTRLDDLPAHHWRRLLFGPESFVPVLLLAVIVILTAPLIDQWKFGFILVFPFSGALVVLSFHRSGLATRHVRLALATTVVAGALVIIAAAFRSISTGQDEKLVATSAALFALLMAIAFPTVVRRAFTHRRIDINTLAAGITAYLIIGIFFAATLRAVSALEGYRIFAQTTQPAAGDYTYFSFITLTTVGYGDLTPGTDAGRSLAIAEAILGQVFLVTAVARIMSLYGTERPSTRDVPMRRDFDESGDDPD